MVRMAGIELELISDIGIHLFIEKGMREVISYVAKRHSKLNNTCNNMMLMNQVNLSCTWMQIIYMVGKWVNFCLIVDLNS